MKICPVCREEYLEHIEMCSSCEEPTVLPDDFVEKASSILSKEELMASNMAAFVEGSLPHCRDIEKVLVRSKIPCVVYPVSLQGSDEKTLGATSEMKYIILVRESDVEQAKRALEGKFYDDVAREGRGEFVTEAIDLDSNEVTCPACGEIGPLADGACTSCGLFLAVPTSP